MPQHRDDSQDRRGADGPPLWQGLEELTASAEFQEYLRREFPDHAETWTDPVTRRRFLTLMGASLALAGLGGCSARPAPLEQIMPYVHQPESLVPGRPLFFATSMPLAGLATGLLVESHEGRPTKVEGNPAHPASLGATDLFSQASVLDLYDPGRSQAVAYRGRPRGWNEALGEMRAALERQRARRGAGLRILTGAVASPTLAEMLTGERGLLKELPEARWYQYEPAGCDQVMAGARRAFGQPVNTYYDFRKADVILSLDADFLACGPAHLRYTHDFAVRRRVRTKAEPPQLGMNRLYVVESTLTSTGAKADHRLPLRAGRVEDFARAVAAQLGVAGAPAPAQPFPDLAGWIEAVSRDLQDHRGACVVIPGEHQSPAVHALAHALNHHLGNAGQTVFHTRPVEARPANGMEELADLVEDMKEGRAELLVILGVNPVYSAPADIEFGKHLEAMGQRLIDGKWRPLRVHLGLYQDETAVRCDWHVPEAHYLESWGDARAFDGTASIIQPLIEPLYAGRSAYELIAALTAQPERTGYDLVRDTWRRHWRAAGGSGDFEQFWQGALQEGVVPDTRFPMQTVSLSAAWAREERAEPGEKGGPLEIVFRPDPTLFDGRFANNAWLQELPKPVTKLTWDNAALMSPATARKYQLSQTYGSHGGEHGEALVDVVNMTYRGRTVVAPVFIVPGHPDDTVTVYLGHGRERAGEVGTGTGFDANDVRTSAAPWFDAGLELRKRPGAQYTLACTQLHHRIKDDEQAVRRAVRAATLAEFREHPEFAKGTGGSAHDAGHAVEERVPGHEGTQAPPADRRLTPLTLYPEYDYSPPKYRWAMAIDLTACVGCSACVVACQAENNIPVVGKEEVTRGREMHWLRIDRYYEGEPAAPRVHFQPVPCMHCENAPCELVCPVKATVHSGDGLNDMVYNRCVGTRYCSNNCPYKVRRFNFLQYADYATESLKLLHNPDVTVRTRGVMEKCTYCVQRIRAAEIEAEKRTVAERERRRKDGLDPDAVEVWREARVRDGEVVTACQAACPAGAIVFGDLNDPNSAVARLKAEPLEYGLLAELNTQPRTTYLAELRNPNPGIK